MGEEHENNSEKVDVVLDHSAHVVSCCVQITNQHQGKTVAIDLGMNVLLASCDGDLLGRYWDWVDE